MPIRLRGRAPSGAAPPSPPPVPGEPVSKRRFLGHLVGVLGAAGVAQAALPAPARADYTVGSGTDTVTGHLSIVGSLGVGTSTPATKLHVVGGGRFETSTANAQVSIVNTATSGQAALALQTATADANWAIYIPGGATDLRWYHSPGGDLMKLTAGGSLGLGPTVPLAKLHVGGDARFEAGGQGAQVAIINTEPSGQATLLLQTAFGNSTANWYVYIPGGSTDLRWYRAGSGETMTLTATGSLGLGTTMPAARLDVLGDARVLSTLSIGNVVAGTQTTLHMTAPRQGADWYVYIPLNGADLRWYNGLRDRDQMILTPEGNLIVQTIAAAGVLSLANVQAGGQSALHIKTAQPGGDWQMFVAGTGADLGWYHDQGSNPSVGQGGVLMTLTAGGNLSVGASIPLAKLHVAGDGRFEGAAQTVSIAAMNSQVGGQSSLVLQTRPGSDTYRQWQMYVGGGESSDLHWYNMANALDSLTLTPSGYLKVATGIYANGRLIADGGGSYYAD